MLAIRPEDPDAHAGLIAFGLTFDRHIELADTMRYLLGLELAGKNLGANDRECLLFREEVVQVALDFTADSQRLKKPLMPGEVATIELHTPKNPGMQRNSYKFSHANGTVKTTLLAKIDG